MYRPNTQLRRLRPPEALLKPLQETHGQSRTASITQHGVAVAGGLRDLIRTTSKEVGFARATNMRKSEVRWFGANSN
jgi:hypothetical protein